MIARDRRVLAIAVEVIDQTYETDCRPAHKPVPWKGMGKSLVRVRVPPVKHVGGHRFSGQSRRIHIPFTL